MLIRWNIYFSRVLQFFLRFSSSSSETTVSSRCYSNMLHIPRIPKFYTDVGVGVCGHASQCLANIYPFGLCSCEKVESQRTFITYANRIQN